jgi:hypothetical protein
MAIAASFHKNIQHLLDSVSFLARRVAWKALAADPNFFDFLVKD